MNKTARSDDEKYWGDVLYEVWRDGGDPDRVNRQDTDRMREDDYSVDEAAAALKERRG